MYWNIILNDCVFPVESVHSFEVSTSSEKIPPTPHRIPPSPSRFAPSPQITRVGSVNLTVQQILKATQNFSPSFKLGEGGFGMVYRAVLSDGQVVAVKRAKKDQFAGPRDEFSNEVELLAKIDHRNLVRLLGFTDKGNERIIITEYVPNGTLREHLDGQHGRVLDFNQRLEIAIDVAHALTYLHLYAEKTIIHRDVKSSNILLTDSYRAKVSDFGFARSGPSDTEKTHISTKVKGTAGYLDPEYLRTYQLTPKSDVFSFGILLVEIISARRPVELKRTPEERITIRWVCMDDIFCFHRPPSGNPPASAHLVALHAAFNEADVACCSRSPSLPTRSPGATTAYSPPLLPPSLTCSSRLRLLAPQPAALSRDLRRGGIRPHPAARATPLSAGGRAHDARTRRVPAVPRRETRPTDGSCDVAKDGVSVLSLA
ncbi:hypothetical protein PR202_ga29912 [Eleusine coracana subsp. coracana]|uniref:Protein kinase domain-containing protein n=1 Tax=Eleusine coracana subsp. coracana TaxID=191504 RepID=A0AAV5DML7_ELECO|nr:hypothetical protein PR202_ga29912 [Eleusine coracana subsp. coracana]